MLHIISRVDGSRKKTARDLVAKLFTITSEFEMDLDEDNPLAPLLRIGMLLQIGDRPVAVTQYMKQRVEDRVKELPVSILLFAASLKRTSSEEGWSRSENMLRLWLVNNDESKQATPEISFGSVAAGQDILRVGAVRHCAERIHHGAEPVSGYGGSRRCAVRNCPVLCGAKSVR